MEPSVCTLPSFNLTRVQQLNRKANSIRDNQRLHWWAIRDDQDRWAIRIDWMVGAWRCRRSDLIGDAFKKKAAEGGTLNSIMKRSPLSLFLSSSDLSATSPPAGNFPRLICRQVRATKLLREDTADCSPDPHLFFSGGEESIINLNSQTFKKSHTTT